MRNAIRLAESFSTQYFCLRNPSFRYRGLVQILDLTVKAGEEGIFEGDEGARRRHNMFNAFKYTKQLEEASFSREQAVLRS